MPVLDREVVGVTGETMTLREALAEFGHDHYFPQSWHTGEPLPCTTCGADPDEVAEAEEALEAEAAEAAWEEIAREPYLLCKHFEGPDCEVCTTGGVSE